MQKEIKKFIFVSCTCIVRSVYKTPKTKHFFSFLYQNVKTYFYMKNELWFGWLKVESQTTEVNNSQKQQRQTTHTGIMSLTVRILEFRLPKPKSNLIGRVEFRGECILNYYFSVLFCFHFLNTFLTIFLLMWWFKLNLKISYISTDYSEKKIHSPKVFFLYF